MKITRSATLPAGVDEAFAVIRTEDYQLAKVRAQVPDATATVADAPGGGANVHCERRLPTAGMPGPVVSMVGDTLTVSEQQHWRPAADDGSRTADLEISVAGVPVSLVGTITLAPEAGASRLSVAADLTCSIPLLGRKIEAASKPAIEQSIDDEIAELTTRLS
ncbi:MULTISPECIES: DUF2505 domain-containing protein [Janibacter]|uniref:DUF2505 domain-containing protein n=1 Tax=Janibacter hoylei PVAS-1 TaxID=1210046 RepID=K1E014_9MICO|nr:DUF2505 domain-containing protein [Janibacter hoylei]EKA60346.1 hypothetical protein B277_13199 [Janibacter hoylei PVAS-1]MCT1619811.1 DUF2505 domain-containing protein [Janibacter hoylei]MCT2292518.1 DUF2505 domain-containing protein [Janibacter hoylei]MCW4600997.1 DUF2505 domain-containing protein [Janibacter hoylei]RWU85774.1 DUF2505 domain-containing protein [Janibacter hoylei PVAS-1]